MDFELIDYEPRFASAVKRCAWASWRFTYSHIFDEVTIDAYVDRFYSEESNAKAWDLVSRGFLRYALAIDRHGAVIGFHTASIDVSKAQLMRLYVSPEAMGNGIGKTLLGDAEAFFRRNGFHSCELKVHKLNSIGKNFYYKNGFQFVTEDNDDHQILRKTLP